MAERVIVRQNRMFETEILAADPHVPQAEHFYLVEHVHQLTPYGMLLAGLAACTAIVLHTYAQYHDVALDEVELRAQYDRVFAEDCEQCETIEEYKEQIEEGIVLVGDLTAQERSKLLVISRQCPIHKMLSHGIEVSSHLVEERAPDEAA
jgi:putative redox protein